MKRVSSFRWPHLLLLVVLAAPGWLAAAIAFESTPSLPEGPPTTLFALSNGNVANAEEVNSNFSLVAQAVNANGLEIAAIRSLSYGRFTSSSGGATSGTNRILPLTTAELNTGGLTLSSNRVSVARTGTYVVTGYVSFDTENASSADNDTELAVYVNETRVGRVAWLRVKDASAVNSIAYLTGSIVVAMNAADNVSLRFSGITQQVPYETRLNIVQLP